MSRLIIYSDYLNTKQKTHLINNLEYIATRDGVALNLNDESFRFVLDMTYADKSVSQNQKNDY